MRSANPKERVRNESAIVQMDREAVRRGGLRTFIKLAWDEVEPGVPYSDSWHVGAIAEHLEAVSRMEIRKLIINVPPGCMKSLSTCVFWPAYHWATMDAATKWLFVSFDSSLTLRDAGKSLKLLTSEWFMDRWGDDCLVPQGSPVGEYGNIQGGFRKATSLEGKTTGHHPNIKVIDDPLKPLEVARSPRVLEQAIEWRKNTWNSRGMALPDRREVIIMQRLHESDLVGYVLKNEPGFEHLKLPMRYDPKKVTYTSIGGDMRTEAGALLWPERIPENVVAELERDLGSRVASAQFQQDPIPDTGQIFKREWFQFYRKAGIPAVFDKIIQSWDMTFKGSDDSDYVVGQVWGKKAGEYYLLDQVRARMSFTETLEAFRALSRKWPRALRKVVEDKANGTAAENVLKKELPGIVLVNPKGGKQARANAVQPMYEAGNVFIPHPEECSWADEFVDEHIKFPMGANDDQVDSGTQALSDLYDGGSGYAAAADGMKKWMEKMSREQ